MKVVKVYGALREQLGQGQFEFVADTPVQALKALLVNFPGLDKWLVDSEERGVAYRVTVGKRCIHSEDVTGMFLPWSEQEVFSITPVMTGAGRGGAMVLVGAALIGLSFVTFGTSAAFAGGAGVFATGSLYAGAGSAILGAVGAGLVLMGVAEIISPTPRLPGLVEQDQATRLESNSFSGIVNTTRQGVPVPIAYGRVFVGGAVISAGLDVDQV